ncbi:glycoside hydrolase family 31 protein [Neobacillus cucumis]|uniref:glycoside hydrolase family 31 protein n=1 Tax=Neobacillus cucumis TaxID=1740721 RepID=UPI0028536438|nr:glycoside hydrolase family 31 protein [Neobacillus cucumis]MDR4945191.1 glycoside hydrolase family 31 protein [Neobacillus cucumis]
MKLKKKKLKKRIVSAVLATSFVASGTVAPLITNAATWVAPPGAQPWEGQMVDANGKVQTVQDEKPLNQNNLQKPMTVQGFEKLENGVKLNLGDEEAYIHLLSPDISKVSILKKGDSEYKSFTVAKNNWDTPKFDIKEDDKKIVLVSQSLTVDIQKSPFAIKYLDKDGNVINEDGQQGVGYENGKPYVFKKTDKSEDFYGFGQKMDGLNHRGADIRVWNRENDQTPTSPYTFSSVPFFIGLKGDKAYGILFDNTYRSYYNMAKESDDYYYFWADGGKLTYYFINGPQLKDVVNRYTDLTGKMQMPPEWSMGFHQSAWGYHQNDVEDVAKTYREKNIPLDGLMLDIEWMDDYKDFMWGSNFPDPDGMNKRLHDEGFHYTTIIDPAIRVPDPGQPAYAPYTDGTNKDLWVKNPDGTNYLGKVWPWGVPSKSVFPNFFLQKTRDWWAQHHKAMFDKGADGIWNDMNEPANFSTKDYWTLPLDSVFVTDDNRQLTHEEAHDLYAHTEAEATDEAFKTLKPNVRPFILTRASFAGTQRYATAMWTGDNWSRWEFLRASIFQDMNVGLSGFAMVGSDIGGFAKNPSIGAVPSPELFARWIEVGAFYPFSRDHYNNDGKSPEQTDKDHSLQWHRQEPWQFGKDVEDISRKYINMRYELMPYLYNAFQRAHTSGSPIMQPLVYQFQNDPNTHNIQDQFMFGDSLMMAPVVYEGAKSRSVYLPAGAKWVDYWTGQEYVGGQMINKQADLATLPIFVKKDSIIPRREVQQHTGEKPLTNLTLDTYLDQAASYSFYEDDANTENYQKGVYNITKFDVKRMPNTITFRQSQEVHNYKDSKIEQYTLKLNNAEKPTRIQAGNSKYQEVSSLAETQGKTNTYFYDANTKTLYVSIPADEKKEVQIH